MKKIFCITLVALLLFALAACGESPDTIYQTDGPKTDTTAAETTETETQVEVVKEGVIKLGDKVEVELTDGWYGEMVDETEVELYNDAIDKTKFANIDVKVNTAWDGDGAEYWNNAINENYGGGKETGKLTINGIDYYVLYAEAEQTILTADVDDKYYLEVDCMFLPFDKCQSQLEKISIK